MGRARITNTSAPGRRRRSGTRGSRGVAPPAAEQAIAWVYTNDLEATCAFYRDRLGLAQVYDQGLCRLFRWGAGSFIGVCRVRPGRYVEPKGVVLTFVTRDVDAWHRHVLANGVIPEAPPERSAAFNVYSFFVRDPNGYRLEFQSFLDPAWQRATA